MTCPRRELGALTADSASAFWQTIPPARCLENVTGREPSQPTTVRVAWHDTELRVLFEARDEQPWATITQRDGPLWEEEVVEVFIDPVGDGACYFEIETNPLGTVVDLVVRRIRSGWRKDFAWDCEALRSLARRTESGWAAELAIPFLSVSAEAPRVGARWRANFCRIDRPKNRERELSAWSPTMAGTFHAPDRFGTLVFGN